MTVANVYVLHGINTPNNFYSQLTSAVPSINTEDLTTIPAGHTQPMFTGALGIAPEINFGTHQCTDAISEFLESSLGADLSGGNTDFHYKDTVDKGTRVADASLAHIRLRCADVFGYITRITAGHNRLAEVMVRLMLLYDGTNNPLVPAGSLALAGTPSAAQHFGLGRVTVNGSTLNGVDEMTLELNPEVGELGSESMPYNTFGYLKSIRPVFTLRTYETDSWATYGLNGTALSSTGLEVYLRKKAADGENVADLTAEHTQIACANGKIEIVQNDGNDSEPAFTELRVRGRAATAAGNVLAIDTTIAHP